MQPTAQHLSRSLPEAVDKQIPPCCCLHTSLKHCYSSLPRKKKINSYVVTGWPFWHSRVLLHLPDKGRCSVALPRKHSEKHWTAWGEGLLSLAQFHPPVPGRDILILVPAFPRYCHPCSMLSAQGTPCSLCMIRQAMFQAGLHQKDTVLAWELGLRPRSPNDCHSFSVQLLH